jgi:2-polyprenyl-3-methyl-5-hydroxy-6-metoxy-1,4-benzoquinol methylase
MECDLCGSNKQDLRYRFRELEVIKCKGCGLVFINEGAEKFAPRTLYSTEYFNERGEYFLQVHDKNVTEVSGEHIESFREGLKLIQGIKQGGRLLDLGCAVGIFLALAKEDGWDVSGVDISDYAVSCARKRCKTEKVYAGELTDAHFSKGSFDVITMWDVVEHLAHPVATLREVHRVLKDDGVLLLDTPNEESLIRNVAYTIYRLLGGRIVYPAIKLYHSYHLYYFSGKTLQRLLDQVGFDLIKMIRKSIPLEKGRGTRLERYIVKTFAALEKPLGMDYEILAIARKKNKAKINPKDPIFPEH